MTVDEVYEKYGRNWCQAMRELKLGVNTYKYWVDMGYIPMPTQKKIEKNSNGELVADCNVIHRGEV